ncbi:hypothetical protein FZEAL_2434 [Fusarium zealandicum]|uniref:Aminoglycoside phosphotransferase domain-containing protein n=1 Tax=Fusarium zealandicum TaxID=1053134 RepID=A0A8H4UQP9_9HYPO|nr:hypothetical protein FZEAL_2434 [Fusarium zealandicum]
METFPALFEIGVKEATTFAILLTLSTARHESLEFPWNQRSTIPGGRTTIPIPRVYAYGRSRLRQDASQQVFMILEYIEGRPLSRQDLGSSSLERRRQFFAEFVDILAQLRELEFSNAGSLMPSKPDSSTPNMIATLSIHANELQLQGYSTPRRICTTAQRFLEEQHTMLQQTYQVPSEELDRETAELEVYALHALGSQHSCEVAKLNENTGACETFILWHTDLRCANIIVDDKLCIHGIIDWEWSGTVPTHLCVPPSWLLEHRHGVGGCSENTFQLELMDVLSSRQHHSANHLQLIQEWTRQDPILQSMARIYQSPSDLLVVFYKCIYPRLYTEPRVETVRKFFLHCKDETAGREVDERLRASERYTRYLKENNLFVEDEESQRQLNLVHSARQALSQGSVPSKLI